jgi:hypothetical protein
MNTIANEPNFTKCSFKDSYGHSAVESHSIEADPQKMMKHRTKLFYFKEAGAYSTII